MKAGKAAKAAAQGAKLAVKYGPQAKLAWDNGGRQASQAAVRRALSVNNRRRALNHASGVIAGSVLKIAPTGSSVYVVFTGDQPIAAYPPQDAPFAVLLEHADLSRREKPADRSRPAEPGTPARGLPRLGRRRPEAP